MSTSSQYRPDAPSPTRRRRGAGEVRVVSRVSGEAHVGRVVCDGPGVIRLLLTWPYNRGGRVVEIPREEVASVEEVEPREMGKRPSAGG